MAKLILAVVLVALVAQSQAFPRALKLWPTRIVGGTVAPVGSVPYQISLRLGGSHICGGSILNERTILTAAHCAVAGSANRFSIAAGLNTLNNPEAGAQIVNVATVTVHPQYSDFTLQNDIAVMSLSSPLTLGDATRTAAVELAPAGSNSNGDAVITGWGTTSESGSISQALRTVTVPIITDAECRQAYGQSDVADSMICAGLDAGGKDSCQGDSGGPMVLASNSVQVGVVSWGIGCARPGYPGVYTEVSYFRDWLAANSA